MTSRLILTAGAGLLLSACGILPDFMSNNGADVTHNTGMDEVSALAADRETGSIRGPATASASASATSSSPSAALASRSGFESRFGRSDGSTTTASSSASASVSSSGSGRRDSFIGR